MPGKSNSDLPENTVPDQNILSGSILLKFKVHISAFIRFFSNLDCRIKDLIKLILFAAFLLFIIIEGAGNIRYDWQWYRVKRYLFTFNDTGFIPGPLLKGLFITLQISSLSLLMTFIFGLVTAVLRLSDSVMSRLIARFYLEAVRNTPLLIQLFFIYFVVSPIFNISAFLSAVIALSLFEGAYTSEIIRAGIIAVPKGQWEAAKSLGMGKTTIYFRIIFPQAFRQSLPILVSQIISLIKDSSLVSTIAIYDLTMRGQEIVADTFLTFEIWFTVAAVYLVITTVLSEAVSYLEKKLNRKRDKKMFDSEC